MNVIGYDTGETSHQPKDALKTVEEKLWQKPHGKATQCLVL
jgi:hypothetical protein